MKLGLEVDRVDAGGGEEGGRLGVGVAQRPGVGASTERDCLAGRTEAADDRGLWRPFAREPYGRFRDFALAIDEPEAGQPLAGQTERVGLDRFGSDSGVGGVDGANFVGSRQVPRLGCLLAQAQPAGTELGADGSVEKQRAGWVTIQTHEVDRIAWSRVLIKYAGHNQ